MNHVNLPATNEAKSLLVARIAAIIAIAAVILGLVSLLLATDLPQVSRRLWEIALGSAVLSVLTSVIVAWLKHETARNSAASDR